MLQVSRRVEGSARTSRARLSGPGLQAAAGSLRTVNGVDIDLRCDRGYHRLERLSIPSSCHGEGDPDVSSIASADHTRPCAPHPANLPEGLARRRGRCRPRTTALHPTRGWAADTPIEHIIVSCQENRSFDHYFGYAPRSRPRASAPRRAIPSPTARAARCAVPIHRLGRRTSPTTGAPSTPQWDDGAMDGFMTPLAASGRWATTRRGAAVLLLAVRGLHALRELLLLVARADLAQPLLPDGRTSGGITTNGLWGYGVFDYPIILDLLDAAGVTWKIYNIGWDSVPFGNTDNVFVVLEAIRP